MNGKRLSYVAVSVLCVLGLAGAASGQVEPPCIVAVAAGPGIELDQLHTTLIEMGLLYVDVGSVAAAQAANATVIIDRYGASNLNNSDVTTWLNSGKGYIQLGDWPEYFANAFTNITEGAPITLTVTDPSSPLATGLPASWTGHGFWAYDTSGSDYIGWATNTALPDVVEATYNSTTYTRVVSSELVGSGRAVYIGFNVYGSLAGANERTLFSNALSWAGVCSVAPVEPIPALGWLGLAVFMAAIAVLGIALASRLN
ncbi:MAG TPA: hypothetical protein VMT19_13425 [Thermoanaerobaculaceae bacterium]|nr:hypothetical protein [Thermoanaerobaculaceae bacterium]